MSLACCSANSHTAPTPASTAPSELRADRAVALAAAEQHGGALQYTPDELCGDPADNASEAEVAYNEELARQQSEAPAVALADANDDKPYDTWGAAGVQRPASSERRPTGFYRCGCGHVYEGKAGCDDTFYCGDMKPVYDDELDDELEDDKCCRRIIDISKSILPPGFRYSTTNGKAIPENMHSSSHSAKKNYIDENGGEIDAQTDAGDEQLPCSAKRPHEVLCPNTPPASPKRARTSNSGGTSAFVPETPPREEHEARFAELEKRVKELQQRVEVLETSEITHKTIVSALDDCIRQMRERLSKQA
tara:strand:+ start:160 stop:1077 length:918 start_codon:yes stop_codon:yes gene_type:complete